MVMGWRIHAYIEWERVKEPVYFNGYTEYARVNIYGGISTSLLIGGQRFKAEPLFSLRGIPKDLSWDVIYEHGMFIREDAETKPLSEFPCITPDKAKELTQTDKWHFIERNKQQWIISANFPSYIFSHEFRSLLIEHEKLVHQHSKEDTREHQLGLKDHLSLKAALAAMQTIEMNGEWRTRFTYWVN